MNVNCWPMPNGTCMFTHWRIHGGRVSQLHLHEFATSVQVLTFQRIGCQCCRNLFLCSGWCAMLPLGHALCAPHLILNLHTCVFLCPWLLILELSTIRLFRVCVHLLCVQRQSNQRAYIVRWNVLGTVSR